MLLGRNASAASFAGPTFSASIVLIRVYKSRRGALPIKDLRKEPKLHLAPTAVGQSGVSVATSLCLFSKQKNLALRKLKQNSTTRTAKAQAAKTELRKLKPNSRTLTAKAQAENQSYESSSRIRKPGLRKPNFAAQAKKPALGKLKQNSKTRTATAQAEKPEPRKLKPNSKARTAKSPSSRKLRYDSESSSHIRKSGLRQPKQNNPSYKSSSRFRKPGVQDCESSSKKNPATKAQAELENQCE